MITDHAGELGAVYIYHGARHALSWRKHFIKDPKVNISQLSEFVDHHLESEKIHLSFFEEVMPSELQTNLATIWKISGYSLGYFSIAVSPHFFYKTIEYVEEFVVEHYSKQIKEMNETNETDNLKKILQSFCDDENEHRKQGLEGATYLNKSKYEYPIWKKIVQSGSQNATTISKYCKGYK